MRYELKISAISGDVIPLCLVAEAMARAASTAYGKTPPHKPIFDYQLPTQTKHLLNEARAGRLHVCNQDGVQGAADEIIAAAKSSGDLSEVRRYLEEPGGATEIDWDTTNILILYSKLHCLNEWGKTRGDSFFISDEPVGWIDERGYMNPTDQSSDDNNEWITKCPAIAQKLGEKRLKENGTRQINASNICDDVAEELALDPTTHGRQGPRGAQNVRTEGLKGWKFIPP